MKEATLKVVVLENKADVNQYRASSVGNMVLPVGSVIVSACVAGIECGTLPFLPNGVSSGLEQAQEWLESECFGKLAK